MDVIAPITSRRTTGLRITLGLICLVLGAVTLLWPGATLLVLAILFGLELLTAGAIRMFAALVLRAFPGWWRGLSGLLGILTLITGVACLARPGTSLLVIIWILALGWLLDGASELVSGFTVSKSTNERIGLVVFGIVSIVAAAVLLVFPGRSLILLAQIGGVALIVFAVVLLASAFTARSKMAKPFRH
jgi:uncharacterized membrane protein HdeD (DUF308 family)